MTTIARTYTPDTAEELKPRARSGGPRTPRGPQPTARPDWFERYTTQGSYGSHMPLDTRLHWDWRNPLNIIPAFMLLLVALTLVSFLAG